MDTTINASVSQVSGYTNAPANQKKGTDKASGASDGGKIPSPAAQGSNPGAGSERTDTVELSVSRIVSESNRAAAETDVEDLDEVVRRIHEIKQWLESEYESAQAQQIHQLDASTLADVLL